jgi:hypothetical protein
MSEEGRDYAVLISLSMREEAEVAAAALRADGVHAFIGNSHHAYTDWGYTIALGGLQIMVPRQRLADAKALLRERIHDNAEANLEDRVSRRDRWKIWVLVVGYYGFPAAAWLLWSWASAYPLHPLGLISEVLRSPVWWPQ